MTLNPCGDGFKRETAHEIFVLRAQAVDKRQATAGTNRSGADDQHIDDVISHCGQRVVSTPRPDFK
jgi:hypothetical protein